MPYRDELIEQLMREGVTLKGQIQALRSQLQQKQGEVETVQSKAGETQLELTEYKEIAEQACNENVLLKREVRQCVCVVYCTVSRRFMHIFFTYVSAVHATIKYMYVHMYIHNVLSY